MAERQLSKDYRMHGRQRSKYVGRKRKYENDNNMVGCELLSFIWQIYVEEIHFEYLKQWTLQSDWIVVLDYSRHSMHGISSPYLQWLMMTGFVTAFFVFYCMEDDAFLLYYLHKFVHTCTSIRHTNWQISINIYNTYIYVRAASNE